MDLQPPSSPHPFEIDEWVLNAVTQELVAIADKPWVDLCQLDRVSRALNELRITIGIPTFLAETAKEYPGIVALHCVSYQEMRPATRDGLADALLAALGLDFLNGPLLLGRDCWREVSERYYLHELGPSPAMASSAESTSDPPPRGRFALAFAALRDGVAKRCARLSAGMIALWRWRRYTHRHTDAFPEAGRSSPAKGPVDGHGRVVGWAHPVRPPPNEQNPGPRYVPKMDDEGDDDPDMADVI